MGSEAVWHRKKSTGLRIGSYTFNSQPCSQPAVTSAKEATSLWFPYPKDPFQPQMLEASEQAKALQKGLPGCQFEVELAVGGAGESTPV